MIKLLIILFLILVIWPIVKVLYYLFSARKFARQQQEAFRKAYSRSADGSDSDHYGGGDNQRHRGRKRKIFSKADGEYVDFEEISSDTTIGEEASATSGTYTREDQVSDAEWTDIK